MPAPPSPAPTAPTGAAPLALTEDDARRALLLDAFEHPPAAPWTAADSEAISLDARRTVGEAGTPSDFVAARARQGLARLAGRDAGWVQVLDGAERGARWPSWALPVSLALGAAAGVLLDAVGASGRIHLLAPPLLALLAWNLVVYGGIALARLRRGGAPPTGGLGRALAALLGRWVVGPVVRHAAVVLANPSRDAAGDALARFALAFGSATRTLAMQRAVTCLHAASAALALGAIASLYLRGIAFEYRAGWDSTFLTGASAHALLSGVLGPAAAATGIALPSVEAFEALRFATGPGENAARWIHLWAFTLGVAIVLPRLALAAASAWQARRIAAAVPVPIDAAALQRQWRRSEDRTWRAWAWPFGEALDADRAARLAQALQAELGARTVVTAAAPTREGAEDTVHTAAGGPAAPDLVVAVMPLAATPERETHGRFLDALAARCAREKVRLAVMVDEGGFAATLPRAVADRRRGERREAWKRLAGAVGVEPWFADLSDRAAAAAAAR
jgi:hypothetical protein